MLNTVWRGRPDVVVFQAPVSLDRLFLTPVGRWPARLVAGTSCRQSRPEDGSQQSRRDQHWNDASSASMTTAAAGFPSSTPFLDA